MLSYLNPRRYIYTAVASENGDSLMGQVILNGDETSARLNLPGSDRDISMVSPFLSWIT